MPQILVKRVREAPKAAEGERYLVDRLWPRGVKKDALAMQAWLKDVAPSSALRRWFGHNPNRWDEFRRLYFAELDAKPDAWRPLFEAAGKGTVTLLHDARDPDHNNAVALREYLLPRTRKSDGADNTTN